jgi:hypothetical protein
LAQHGEKLQKRFFSYTGWEAGLAYGRQSLSMTLLPLTTVTKTKEHDFVGNLARAGRSDAKVKLSLWRQVLDENVYLQHPEKK